MNTYPDNVQLEEVPCPVDHSMEYTVVIEGRDHIYDIPGTFQVVRCNKCGLMRTLPRPTQETIHVYYPPDYRPYHGTRVSDVEVRANRGQMPLIKRLLKRFIHFNTAPIPDLPPGNMLEIGCASGSFLHRMHQLGWQVEGIEPDEQAAEAARQLGYSIYTGSVETAPHRAAKYDLVVGWMVVEHLHQPIESLRKLHDWTRPGGWLVISVPNARSFEFRLFRSKWFALQLPTHTFHYTPQTIRLVLEQSGWQVESIYHQRILTNLFISIGYWLQSQGVNNRLTRFLTHFSHAPWRVHQMLYPLAWLLSLFGQTGRMSIWARRDD